LKGVSNDIQIDSTTFNIFSIRLPSVTKVLIKGGASHSSGTISYLSHFSDLQTHLYIKYFLANIKRVFKS
jgi:hypothetical protein